MTQTVPLTSMTYHFWRSGGFREKGLHKKVPDCTAKSGEQCAGVRQKVEAATCEELI